MEENQYLDPGAIKSQCSAAIAKMERDNDALSISAASINQFASDAELSSAAYQSLKQQLCDYLEIITSLTTANQTDISDFGTLQGTVGDEVLDGSQIIPNRDNAKNDKDYHIGLSQDYCWKGDCEGIRIVSLYYHWKSWYYARLADWDDRSYQKWKEKADKYDEIEAATSGLFSSTDALRSAAIAGLTYLGKTFDGSGYNADNDASWRQNLYAAQKVTSDIAAQQALVDELKKEGYTIDDLSNMDADEQANVIGNAMSAIADNLPTLKLGDKYTMQLEPDITVEYSVEGTLDGNDAEVAMEIEDNKLKLKSIGVTPEGGGRITVSPEVHTDGEMAVGVEDDNGGVKLGVSGEGKPGTSAKIKCGDSTYELKGEVGLTEISVEESVETNVADKGSVKSTLKLTKQNLQPQPETVPVEVSDYDPVTVPQSSPSFSMPEVDPEVVGGVAAVSVVCIVAGILLAPETGGLSLGLCFV